MKNIVLLILFLITTFILNVIFYYKSSDYRDFLRLLKSDNNPNLQQEFESKRDLLIKQIKQEEQRKIAIGETLTGVVKETDLGNIPDGGVQIKTSSGPENTMSELKAKIDNQEKEELKKDMKLGKVYQDILDKFSKYKLDILEINTSLFDVTNEYPDEYFEYYSRDLTLYFFPTKTYDDLYDIFKVLAIDLPFNMNEVNNFGDRSFYINLDENIADAIVRVVVDYNGIIFGVKVKASQYENVKKILQNL